MWQRILASALAESGVGGYSADYLDSLVKVGEFFFARQVPKAASLLAEIEAGSESVMALAANQF
jgi:hypothetical protein